MQIFFDFEITNTHMPSTSTVNIVLTELKSFIKQRLKVLDDEINKYEDGCIVLNVLGTIKQPLGISIVNYPDTLKSKIVNSLREADFVYNYNVILSKIADS